MEAGLPVGLQIIAAFDQEEVLLRVAAAMEDAMGFGGQTAQFITHNV
jgi:Asp-tRNA(Asn)/Glu-tRNA(Gln) amidotransferase A subunit family amidase